MSTSNKNTASNRDGQHQNQDFLDYQTFKPSQELLDQEEGVRAGIHTNIPLRKRADSRQASESEFPSMQSHSFDED